MFWKQSGDTYWCIPAHSWGLGRWLGWALAVYRVWELWGRWRDLRSSPGKRKGLINKWQGRRNLLMKNSVNLKWNAKIGFHMQRHKRHLVRNLEVTEEEAKGDNSVRLAKQWIVGPNPKRREDGKIGKLFDKPRLIHEPLFLRMKSAAAIGLQSPHAESIVLSKCLEEKQETNQQINDERIRHNSSVKFLVSSTSCTLPDSGRSAISLKI